MPNERSVTDRYMKTMTAAGWFVLKHSDRFTAGVPDTSATRHGITRWVEIKYLRRGKTLFDELDAIQTRTLQRLDGWVLAYKDAGKEADLYAARDINYGARFAFPAASFGGRNLEARVADYLA